MIVLMGVAGSGKTTVGKILAELLECPFYEGDDFHPPRNIEKMKEGRALMDQDREPWLKILSEKMVEWRRQNPLFVLSCSALKAKYRSILENSGPIRWVYLNSSFKLAWARLAKRKGHYFPVGLLESQFRDLEEPDKALKVENILPPGRIAGIIRDRLNLELK